MAGFIRTSEGGFQRFSEGSRTRVTEDFTGGTPGDFKDLSAKINVFKQGFEDLSAKINTYHASSFDLSVKIGIQEGYKNAVHEDYQNKTTEDGNNRVYENSSIDPSQIYKTENLPATIDVIGVVPKDLGAKVYISSTDSSDLAASILVMQKTTSDLSASMNILPYSDLGASISVYLDDFADLSSKLTITIPVFEDLGAKIGVVDYYYKNLLAKIFIKGTKDLSGSIYVIPYENLGAKISIITALMAKITIPAKRFGDLGGYLNVTTDHQELKAFINIGSETSKDLKAKINITWAHQRLGGKVAISTSGYTDALNGWIYVNAVPKDLPARINVTVEHQQLKAKLTVLRYLSADLLASADIEASTPPNPPVPIAYVPPSGYPPLPGEWVDASGYAVAPSGAQIIQDGAVQDKEEILFIWEPLEDWGLLASGDGYIVAWNDDPDYEVTLSDQFVPDNYVDKSWYDGGSIYFHIKPKNSYGWLGPQATYNIIINNLPSAVGDPLLVDGEENPEISNLRPDFSWGKATDVNQLDVLRYHIQISEDYSFSTIIREYDTVAAVGAGVRSNYTIPPADKLPSEERQYFWRVRAYDGWEYGEWSAINSFLIKAATYDLGARFTIPIYDAKSLQAKIGVLPYKDLGGSIAVSANQTVDLPAIINVSYKDVKNLSAKIRIFTTEDLGAKITIINYRDLQARIVVIDIPGHEDLNGKIEINEYFYYNLGARINVGEKDVADLTAKIFIPAFRKLDSSINIYTSERFGHLFGENLAATIKITRLGTKDLEGSIFTIADRPGPVSISANIPEAEWQTENDVDFTWTASAPGLSPVVSYHTQIDTNPTTQASDSFQNSGVTFARSFDLELLSGAQKYYFHVAAKNDINNFGPTDHYEVWYNHIPTNPTGPMFVNSLESIIGNPIVGATSDNIFEWGQSYDEDTLDSVKYIIQIATREDFGLEPDESSSIVYLEENISTFFHSVNGGVLNPGSYFWRVKASDSKQESEGWSPTASFTVNTPPLAPTNLLVFRG